LGTDWCAGGEVGGVMGFAASSIIHWMMYKTKLKVASKNAAKKRNAVQPQSSLKLSGN
jgi:hypothetical protein